MSDDAKPILLSIGRDQPDGDFTAVFQISPTAGNVSIKLPSKTAEEHLLEVARDHFHRLMKDTAEATTEWVVPDDRRQEIDPDRKQPTEFRSRRSLSGVSSGGSWMAT